MILTTYTCDRCGHQQNNDNQMWEINLQIRHHDRSYSSWNTKGTQLWCRKCVDEMQLMGFPPLDKESVPVPEMTFEEKLREIIRHEIQENQP